MLKTEARIRLFESGQANMLVLVLQEASDCWNEDIKLKYMKHIQDRERQRRQFECG